MDASRPRPSHRRRELLVLVMAATIAVGSWLVQSTLTGPGAASPSRAGVPAPNAHAAADAGAPAGLSPADRIRFWTRRVDEQPTDFLSLAQLAVAHADLARTTHDVAAYDRAAEAIERALQLSPDYPPTLRARASIRFAIHDFAGAAADAERVLDRLPGDPAALAVLGDARLELGAIALAGAAFDRLAQVAGGPAVDIRLARLAYLTGDVDEAVRRARRALAGAPEDPLERAFYAYAAGEYARLSGDAAAARSGYELALSLRSDDLPALLGLARLAAFEGDTAAALGLLERAATIAPLPEILALTTDLRRLTGDDEGAGQAAATVRLAGRLAGAAGSVFDRQLLAFEVDHGGATRATLDAAVAALDERRDAAGHDLAAWAAYRLGRLDQAAVHRDAALATGSRDARILFHAGAIALARGDRADGLELLEAAVALGPALDPADTAEARRLLAEVSAAPAG